VPTGAVWPQGLPSAALRQAHHRSHRISCAAESGVELWWHGGQGNSQHRRGWPSHGRSSSAAPRTSLRWEASPGGSGASGRSGGRRRGAGGRGVHWSLQWRAGLRGRLPLGVSRCAEEPRRGCKWCRVHDGTTWFMPI